MTEPVLVTKPVGGDNGRVKKLAIIGGVIVLALVVLPKLFGGGGGGGSDDLTATPGGVTPTTIAAGPHRDVQAVGSYGGKDPFRPLIEVADTSASATPAASRSTVTDTSGLGLPLPDSGSLVDDSDPAAPGDATPATTVPPRPTHRFYLLEVYQDPSGQSAARVRIDDTVMQAVVGQDFGGNYRILSLDRDRGCGVFLFADQRFSLCERGEIQT